MVISRRLRCIYVELPHTGSTSVSEELCAHYGGERILRKHAHYREFYRAASPDERRYFVFSGIRNPLDEVVSLYFRYKTNHTLSFTNPLHLARNGGWVTEKHLRQYRFVTEEKGNFEGYVRTFYRRPYDNWSRVAHPSLPI